MIGLVMKAAVDIPAMTGLTASLKILPPRAASSTFGIRLTTAGKIEVTGFTVLETIFPPPFPTTGTDKTGTRTEVAADMMLVRTPFMIDGTGVATGNTIAVASLKMLDIRPWIGVTISKTEATTELTLLETLLTVDSTEVTTGSTIAVTSERMLGIRLWAGLTGADTEAANELKLLMMPFATAAMDVTIGRTELAIPVTSLSTLDTRF
jgi:hypothetical protein